MSIDQFPIACIIAGATIAVIYITASATGIICRLRGHRWMHGTSLDETTHGRDCMRCNARQRWWSQWFLSRFPSFEDGRPDDMKAAGRWRGEP